MLYVVLKSFKFSRTIKKGDIQLDNRYVVPCNEELLLMFKAHINTEWCNITKAIKYLFKYVNKGVDRATILIENGTSANGDDEITTYLDCRYLSACESAWRIFQFDIQYRNPSVIRLQVHLEHEHSVTLRDADHLPSYIRRDDLENTMFTEWMKMNIIDTEA